MFNTTFQKRKATVERSFGELKRNDYVEAEEKNQSYTHLICAIQNINNIVIKQDKADALSSSTLLEKITKNIQKIIKLHFLKFA